MKDIHHRDLVAIGDLVDLLEDVGESGPGNDGVVQVVVGRDLGDGAERGLAALPECSSLLLGASEPHVGGGIGPTEFLDTGGVDLDPTLESFEFGEQHGGGIGGVTGSDIVLDRNGHALIHHLERGGHDTGGDDVADGLRSVADRGERQQQGAHGRGVGCDPDPDLGGDPERALAANERAAKVESGGLILGAAEHGDLPVGQYDFQRHDVGIGDAVGEAVGASGIVGDIAAERADLLARRVGGEVESLGPQLLREVEIDDAGLHPGDAVVRVDRQHLVHPAGRYDDGPPQRDCAAGESGAGATGNHGRTVLLGDSHDRLDLFGGLRKAHRAGDAAVEHGGVMRCK